MNFPGLLAAAIFIPLAGMRAGAADAKPAPTRAETNEKSVADIAAEVKPSLVKVIQEGREGRDGLGSGFVLRADGLIATNRHVIGEARRIKVEMSDGKVEDVTEVFATDARMDLAILRIARKDLKPLPLGDSAALRQGERIVAMGNPIGLAFSVVEGVVSEPKRDIEGVEMIQVAVPIEHGNSGGPLLDRQGRVMGLLTMKSAVTENLGFAMPVNPLKALLEKPNPVPMERWLTIGVLNPRTWKPLMGGQWSQRAGVLNVEQPGDGFGGRALCLWMAEKPTAEFEAEVTVRLDDEAGAAGLTFCWDGERHYGFYPTGGKLRLTRFDGPDVFTWKILADSASDAYRPGDWNTLRVHVDAERVRCLVNGREVFNFEDSDLRGGRAGVCKFRTTKASYKGFRIGKDLAEKPADPALVTSLQKSMDGFLDGKTAKDRAMDSLLKNPDAAKRVLAERRKAVEQSAESLRNLERELHRGAIVRELAQELSKPDDKADLLRCALLVSRHDNPELDVEGYVRGFGQMADDLRNDAEIKKGTAAAVKRIAAYLFEQGGFHGSRHDFDSRSNSYINEVLDDREGLPITLSIIFMELASRLGVRDVAGIPLPTRFMVGWREKPDGEFSLLDVFDGGKALTMDEAKALVSGGEPLPDASTRPATKKEIIVRMIRNLLGRAVASDKAAKDAPPYFNLLLAVEPDAFRERLTRARMRETFGDRSGAAGDIGWLLEHPPKEFGEDQLDALAEWMGRLKR